MKLTERQEYSAASSTDLIHIVVTGDTSQSPSGSSYKLPLSKVVDLVMSGITLGVESVSGTTNQIDVDNTDPQNPVLSLSQEVLDSLALADSSVQSVTGSTVDNTDPNNPVINIYYELTKSQADAAILANKLVAGALYKITGVDPSLYGGTDIFLTAITTNKFNTDGYGIFYTPKYHPTTPGFNVYNPVSEIELNNISGLFRYRENITANNGATGRMFGYSFTKFIPLTGDWSTATSFTGDVTGVSADILDVTLKTYSINDVVHWGGLSWRNVNGNLGTSIDIYNLDSEWEVIDTLSDYNYNLDYISYNIEEDYIFFRKDKRGNEVYKGRKFYSGNPDPIKSFQWGHISDVRGVYMVKVIDGVFENINFNGSDQNNITVNSSIQRDCEFGINSGQSNITLVNTSLQQSITLEGWQMNVVLDNSSHSNIHLSVGCVEEFVRLFRSTFIGIPTYSENVNISGVVSNFGFIQYVILPDVFKNILINGATIFNKDLTSAVVLQEEEISKTIIQGGDGNPYMQYIDNTGIFITTSDLLE